MRGGDGKDVLTGTTESDSIYGAGGDDLIQGLGASDVLVGEAGDDSLYGGDGNDYLIGGSGNDLLSGGVGTDWADYADAGSAITLDLSAAGPQDTRGAGIDVLVGIERLYGSGFDDRLTGDSNGNLFQGGDGADALKGGGGRDSLIGGAGNDQLIGGGGPDYLAGGSGDDTYVVNSRSDLVGEGLYEGIDTVVSAVSYRLGANLENLTLTGPRGLSGWGNALGNQITGGGGGDHLHGGGGGDTLLGGKGDDHLDAGSTGSQDQVRLDGGDGDDVMTVGSCGFATIDGGAGDDWLDYSANGRSIGLDLRTESPQFSYVGLLTITGVENLIGSAYDDFLVSGLGGGQLRGGRGADTLLAYGVSDVLIGGDGDDLLDVRGHDAVLQGGRGSDTLSFFDITGSGDDMTSGWTVDLRTSSAQDAGEGRFLTISGVENLEGSEFDDVFTADAHANVLSGRGGGADTFRFFSLADCNGDLITNTDGDDRVDLSGIDANQLLAGDQAFHLVRAFTGAAGQMSARYDEGSGRTTLRLDVNGDGAADATFHITGDHHTGDGFVF